MTTLNLSCVRPLALACVLAAIVSLSACDGNGNNDAPTPTAPTMSATQATPPATQAQTLEGDYPLDVCVVSGAKLGSMGDPIVFNHEGREVRFCCGNCIDDFKAEPAKFLAKLDAGKSDKPADEHAGHDH